MDERKSFIVEKSADFFGAQPFAEKEKLQNDSAIANFLDVPSCCVLVAQKGSTGLIFNNSIDDVKRDAETLVFTKVREAVLEHHSMSDDVVTVSFSGSSDENICKSLGILYQPLAEQVKPTAGFELSSLTQQQQNGLELELKFWNEQLKNPTDSRTKQIFSKRAHILGILINEVNSLEVTPLRELEESSSAVLGILDDLWKIGGLPFPQNRMEHILELCGKSLTRSLQTRMNGKDLWNCPCTQMNELISQAIGVCTYWINECKRYTETFWVSEGKFPWKGTPFLAVEVQKFRSRLEEISEIRATLNHTAEFIPGNDVEEASRYLSIFQAHDCLSIDSAGQKLWKTLMGRFNEEFFPAEQKLTGILREILTSNSSEPQTVLDNFLRYKNFLKRPRIVRELVIQKETFQNSVKTWASQLKQKININDQSENREIPENLRKVCAIRHLESQVDVVLQGIEYDSLDFGNLKEDMKLLKSEMRDKQREIFDSWSRTTLEEIQNKSLALSSDSPVVSFDRNKLMKINFNPDLVILIREVNFFSGLGFKILPEIWKTTETAEQFVQQARALEQIANFHNTIGDRMIACLKPLVLDTALELASMVQQQNAVKWTQTDKVNSYIDKLQTIVDRLSKQIQKLTQCHFQIREKVIKLFDTDLVKHQSKWKEILREIRLVFSTIEAQGFKNLTAWKQFWDHQLYKALEFQYKRGLKTLHENLPEYRVDLDFKQQTLQFYPPMEEIRRELYAHVRKFVSIPLQFKGFCENKTEHSIFTAIVDSNCSRFEEVYQKADLSIQKLEEFKGRYKLWVAPALIDIEQIIAPQIKSGEDWDSNFKAAKSKGQEIAKLSWEEEKIGNILINTLPLRRAVENIHRRFWDSLLESLHLSINENLLEVERFAQSGTQVLEKRAQNLEEFAEASAKFARVLQSAPQMAAVMEEAEKKAAVLSSWTREKLDTLPQVQSLWQSFNGILQSHQEAIQLQLETLKATIKSEVDVLTNQAERLQQRWIQVKPKDDIFLDQWTSETAVKNLNLMKEKRQELNLIIEAHQKMNSDLEKFGENSIEIFIIKQLEEDLSSCEALWSSYDQFINGLEGFGNEEWIVFRSKIHKVDEYLDNWSQKLESGTNKSPIIIQLIKDVASYKSLIPGLKLLRGETFSERHWAEVLNMISLPSKPVETILVKDFLGARDILISRLNELKELNMKAAGEAVVRQALLELDQWEMEARWNLFQHTDTSGNRISLVKEYKELLNKVGENLNLIQSVKDSTYYQAFGDRITLWENKMTDLDLYLRQLSQIQRKWLYLEPVFSRVNLSKDSGRFRRLDADFRYIMSELERNPKVVSLTNVPNLKSTMANLLEQIGRCQKNLREYLEEKRSKFPRFYFLGNDDLLDILGQATSKPVVIQQHLKKLFAGIHKAQFSNDMRQIIGVSSPEGETFQFKNPVEVTQDVEVWLNDLVEESRSTLRVLLKTCLGERLSGEQLSPLRYPSQILCLTEMIVFTERCEKSIASGSVDKLLSDYKNQLNAYTSAIQQDNDPQSVLHLKLQALILDVIHFVDIIEQLVEAKCRSVQDWVWQKQLRFYMKQNGTVVGCMAGTELEYTYEYQGNAAKLVYTPLTDKCYLTLTLAMKMGLGGNPYGPAGTGKTESVKALASLLGRQVLVFNCDEGLDVKSMGRIFMGLAKCGAWGCFDEFNRLDESTLSTVSTLIDSIQSAIKERKETATILNNQVKVSEHTGIFVTMNPAGKDYGGRQKLPNNLKQLFRPVVMSQPDNELIAAVLLYAQGFQTAKILGKKLVEVFRLAQKLLSPQQHYDWGLRALKSVLRTAGDKLRSQPEDEKKDESFVIVQSLFFNTLSKLVAGDRALFEGLVFDMFPEAREQNLGSDCLAELVRQSYEEMGLTFMEKQAQKVLEVYEQLKQRMGVVIVGPPRTGKTTVWNILKHALIKQNISVKTHVVNPKSISRNELLGFIDHDTREWTDGILVKTARTVIEEPTEVTSWIVCDGDVDPEWIEALNSVLDDNRLLTLATGECIRFSGSVNFVFETCDLTFASPATVSRMGVIFFSEEDIDVKGIVEKWILSKESPDKENLVQWTTQLMYAAVEWVRNQSEYVMQTSLVSTVTATLTHLNESKSRTHFAASIIRGLASNLPLTAQNNCAKQILKKAGEDIPNLDSPFHFSYDIKRDILIDLEPMESFWSENSTNQNDGIFISTRSLTLTYHLFQPWLERMEHFLVIGPTACGKSLLLDNCFKQLRSVRAVTVHCTADTKPQHIIKKLFQASLIISNSNGRTLRPRESSRLILYLKDLNIVAADKYGTCQLVAFLEQVISHGGFYEETGDWLTTENLQIVSSMNSDSGEGRFQLSPRFLSLVRIASIPPLDTSHMEAFCSGYLTTLFSNASSETKKSAIDRIIPILSNFLVNLDTEIRKALPSSPFTCRHVQQLAAGLSRYELSLTDQDSFTKALCYESIRVYHDCLENPEQRKQCIAVVHRVIQEEWPQFSPIQTDGAVYVTSASSKSGKLGYLTLNDWKTTIQKAIQQYEREHEPLQIELLPEFLEACSRADRILSSPAGNLLLPGRPGAGRHSVIKIVSTLHNARIVSPNPGKNYSRKQFNNDLKTVMQLAGIEGEKIFFVMEDHHFVDPAFFSVMDSLLASGDVLGLFTNEEFDSISSPVKELASQEGIYDNTYSFFCQRVKKNLHAVFIMDNRNNTFQSLSEKHSSLYKYSSCLWIEEWSEQSYFAVASEILKRTSESDDLQIDADLIQKSIEIFDSIEAVHKCPRRFVAFMETFCEILHKKRQEIANQQQRIQTGVSKLHEARETVHRLKSEAAEQEQLLALKQSESQNVLQKITDTIQSASLKKGELQELREKMIIENKKLSERKKGIDAELAEIEPLLTEARTAVSDIRPEALSEIRSLRAPPDTIRDILEGVLRLMGILDTSWTSMKSFLAKRGVKEDIRAFDARKIGVENRRSVEALLDSRKESFDPKAARRASAAAAPLAAWVQANVRFSRVLERIAPLEQEQATLQKNLKAAEDHMSRLSTGLDDVDEQVAVLRQQMAMSTREAMEVEINLKKARDTLTDSQNLVGELEDEYQRWQQQLKDLESTAEKNALFSLLAAAWVSFAAGLSERDRKQLGEKWLTILGMSSFSLQNFLSTEQELLQWRSQGLSVDETAVENAISILQNNTLTPFILDNAGKSISWVRNHFKTQTVEVTSQDRDNFFTVLELALRFGKTLLIEDSHFINPVLIPLLRNEKLTQGTRQLVKLGDKQIDWNSRFRLLLFCRSSKCPLNSDTATLVNIINFNTTAVSLSEQLLGLIVKYENPELEQRKLELIREEENLKAKLTSLEDQLLEMMARAQGNILENKDFLNSLKQLKTSSVTVTTSLSESLNLQAKLDTERQKYSLLADFGSRLYFAITELTSVNHYYQFSVQFFTRIFLKVLKNKKSELGSEKSLRQSLLRSVYFAVCRGVFKTDIVAVGVHLLHRMEPELFLKNEWEVFTKELTSLSRDSSLVVPRWLDESQASALAALKEHLPNVYNALQFNTSSWENSSSLPTELPSSISKSLSPFQQVLATQALFPDKLMNATRTFLCRLLGTNELFEGVAGLRSELEETFPSEPVLLILPNNESGSNDMSSELAELASSTLGSNSYLEVAMGADQTEAALELVRSAAGNGHWICLKNVHLVTGWLPALERYFSELSEQDSKIHPNFRLWMTSEPVPTLPSTLVQRCKKIVCEAPRGIKRNLHRNYELLISARNSNQPVKAIHQQALFVLIWCHAVIQERCHYVPQGWLKSYEFNNADLKAASDILEHVLKNEDHLGIRWDCMQGLCLDAIYGGRVEVFLDWRVLKSYFEQYFSNKTIGSHSSRLVKDLQAPLSDNIQDYWAMIRRLPDQDDIIYLDLPLNIENTLLRKEAFLLLERLEALSTPVSTEQSVQVEELNSKINSILELWKSLLQGSTLLPNKATSSDPWPKQDQTGSEPLAAFVKAEATLALHLVHCIHRTLSAVNRYLKTSVQSNSAVAQITIDLAKHATPGAWLKLWSGPEDLKKYLRFLVRKARALHEKWIPAIASNTLLQQPLQLFDLMSPEAFFGIFRQHTARHLGVAMDSLEMFYSWGQEPAAQNALAVSVSGLYVQGAVVTSRGLEPCQRDTPAWISAPLCTLTWKKASSELRTKDNALQLPLYEDASRQKLIATVDVPFATGSREDWYRAAVALALQD